MQVPSPATLEALMDRAWPALEYIDVGSWRVRLAAGVTRRANSVLPASSPAGDLPPDLDAAITAVEQAYAAHGLPAAFQIVRPDSTTTPYVLDRLEQALTRRGYRTDAPTLVCVAPAAGVIAALHERARSTLTTLHTDVSAEPDEGWLDLWWSVDGRGDDAARTVAHRILIGAEARYVTLRDDHGVAAVGRLALIDGHAGLYALAVRPDVRRVGLGGALLFTLADAAGGRPLWLQVMTANVTARRLYHRAGFTTAATCHYRLRGAGAPEPGTRSAAAG